MSMELLAQAMYARREAPAATTGAAPSPLTLDSAAVTELTLDAAGLFDTQLVGAQALHIVNTWVETDDLAEGELLADRLMNMLVGIADEDKDGDLTEEEQVTVNVALNAVFDYLLTMGVSEDDADALLSDWSDDVAQRVRDLLAANLPDGEDESDAVVDAMVFTPADQAPVFDSVDFDAAYKKVVAIRAGKKVRINKRIAGRVVLSARQKVALRKARAKAFNPGAMARRARSNRMRRSMGM